MGQNRSACRATLIFMPLGYSSAAMGTRETLEYEQPGRDAMLADEQILADLGAHSTRGGLVMIASQATQLLIGFVATLILARLLTPSDFGLVAMVASVMAFVSTM